MGPNKVLSKSDRLALIGLQALAIRHNAALEDIKATACEIFGVGKEEDDGHVMDFIYDPEQRPGEKGITWVLDGLARQREQKATKV